MVEKRADEKADKTVDKKAEMRVEMSADLREMHSAHHLVVEKVFYLAAYSDT